MNNLKITTLELEGLKLIQSLKKIDSRGFLARLYCSRELFGEGDERNIKQINLTYTRKCGSVRGLHFQRKPYHDAKIVTCLKGTIWDVVVDIRKNSPTFLSWHGRVLNSQYLESLFVPEGFAHGFQTLTDDVELLYLHSSEYQPDFEAGIPYDEPSLSIPWPKSITFLSKRDKSHKYLEESYSGEEL